MFKKYWKFIFPSTLSFLLSGIYSIVDGIFVGKAMGDTGLAAINIAWPLVALIISLGTGIGMGASVMISLNKGAGDHKTADRMEGNAFFLLFAGSLLLTAILYLFGSPALALLGAEGKVHTDALTYLRYILYGAIVQATSCGTIPLMRNRSASFYAMCSMACGCILNIVLDYLFILVYNMGMKGAALATVFGQCITLLFSIAFFLKKKNRISPKNLIPSGKAVSSILKVAVSPFGLTYLPSVTILLMNLQCLRYGGDEAVSAYAVLAYLVSFMELLIQGVSDGAQPLLSLSKGQGNKKALQKYTVWTFVIGICLGLISGFSVLLLRSQIPVFFGTSDTAAAMIIHAAAPFALVMVLYGLTKPAVSYFYATEALLFSGFLVYGEIILTLVIIFCLPLLFRLDGVWYTMPSVQIILGAMSILFLMIRKKKL